MNDVQKEAERLYNIFGKLAPNVVDELLNNAYSGYDYDAEAEIPFYNDVKEYLKSNLL